MKSKIGKITVFALLAALCAVMLAACADKTKSIEDIKPKYKEAGYRIETMSRNALGNIAGAEEGFKAFMQTQPQSPRYKSIVVEIFKFGKKELAEEFVENGVIGVFENGKTLIKGTFVCNVRCVIWSEGSGAESYAPDSDEAKAAMKIFEACF